MACISKFYTTGVQNAKNGLEMNGSCILPTESGYGRLMTIHLAQASKCVQAAERGRCRREQPFQVAQRRVEKTCIQYGEIH